jgi:hypothetical protein
MKQGSLGQEVMVASPQTHTSAEGSKGAREWPSICQFFEVGVILQDALVLGKEEQSHRKEVWQIKP